MRTNRAIILCAWKNKKRYNARKERKRKQPLHGRSTHIHTQTTANRHSLLHFHAINIIFSLRKEEKNCGSLVWNLQIQNLPLQHCKKKKTKICQNMQLLNLNWISNTRKGQCCTKWHRKYKKCLRKL